MQCVVNMQISTVIHSPSTAMEVLYTLLQVLTVLPAVYQVLGETVQQVIHSLCSYDACSVGVSVHSGEVK